MRCSLLPLALLLLAPAPALADGFIVVEEPPPELRRQPPLRRHFPLAVKRHDVTVTIEDQVATTTVDQEFENGLDVRLEGTYVFPLPEEAAVTDFSLWIDGQETKGEVLERDKAQQIYEGIVRRMQDPALLEFAGRGVFKLRIFPIEPRSTRRIKLTYRQVLGADAGRVRYRYPLNTEKFSSAPLGRASVLVSLRSSTPIRGIYAPWHTVDVVRASTSEAKVSWEATNVLPDQDFVLDYDLDADDVGLSLRTFALPAEDGTFLLLVSPGLGDPADRVPQDVVFVVDTSGTMAAEGKMEQARRALDYCIQRLDPRDRFALVDFATDARCFRDALAPADADHKAAAAHYVRELTARGGTAIDEALQRALRYYQGDKARPFQVVFLTDGQPTIGETDPERILANVRKAAAEVPARVFVWGVGNDVNAHLLDRLALAQRGDRNYVLPGEDIEVAMSSFYDKIASPALTDLELSFTGVKVLDVFPRQLPDLFHGGQLVVVGRFQGEGHGAVRLKGRVRGEPREFVWEGAFRRADDNPHLPRLWAMRKIGWLLEQIRLNGEHAELKDEVVRLARRYGIPTPYTSYLVLEEGAQARGGDGPRPAEADGEQAAQQAFRRLEERSKARGEGYAQAPAAAPSGADAVREARENATLARGGRVELEDLGGADKDELGQVMRTVQGRTFYRQGEGWIESTLGAPEETWRTLTLFSPEFFELARAHPELGAFLALGKVTFRAGEVVYRIQ